MEQVFEPVWRCRLCNSSGLLEESHQCCPNCGHKRDYEEIVYPDWDDLVAVEDHRFTGFAHVCCGRRWSKLARFCGQCGTLTSMEEDRVLKYPPDLDPTSNRTQEGLLLTLVRHPQRSVLADAEADLEVSEIVDRVREGSRSWHV